jgi:hypothetical protein
MKQTELFDLLLNPSVALLMGDERLAGEVTWE